VNEHEQGWSMAIQFNKEFHFLKQKAPARPCGPNGGKLGGWEFATLSFPLRRVASMPLGGLREFGRPSFFLQKPLDELYICR
jgi:hypothetical protein